MALGVRETVGSLVNVRVMVIVRVSVAVNDEVDSTVPESEDVFDGELERLLVCG